MLLFTSEGPRSINEADVIGCQSEARCGIYCTATLILRDGDEVTGRAVAAAVGTPIS
jgi:hypothetical protein